VPEYVFVFPDELGDLEFLAWFGVVWKADVQLGFNSFDCALVVR